MRHHVWDACPDAFLRLYDVKSSVETSLRRLSRATKTSPGAAFGVARDAALPEPGRALAQMSCSGLWRITVPRTDPAYVKAAQRAETVALALPHLLGSPSVAGTLKLAV